MFENGIKDFPRRPDAEPSGELQKVNLHRKKSTCNEKNQPAKTTNKQTEANSYSTLIDVCITQLWAGE